MFCRKKVRIFLSAALILSLYSPVHAQVLRKWSLGGNLEVSKRVRSGLSLQRRIKERGVLGFIAVSPQLTFVEKDGHEEFAVALSYYRDYFEKKGLKISAGTEAGILFRNSEGEKVDTGVKNIMKPMVRLAFRTSIPFSSKISVSEKIGFEYSVGRPVYPVLGICVDFSWGIFR